MEETPQAFRENVRETRAETNPQYSKGDYDCFGRLVV